MRINNKKPYKLKPKAKNHEYTTKNYKLISKKDLNNFVLGPRVRYDDLYTNPVPYFHLNSIQNKTVFFKQLYNAE